MLQNVQHFTLIHRGSSYNVAESAAFLRQSARFAVKCCTKCNILRAAVPCRLIMLQKMQHFCSRTPNCCGCCTTCNISRTSPGAPDPTAPTGPTTAPTAPTAPPAPPAPPAPYRVLLHPHPRPALRIPLHSYSQFQGNKGNSTFLKKINRISKVRALLKALKGEIMVLS